MEDNNYELENDLFIEDEAEDRIEDPEDILLMIAKEFEEQDKKTSMIIPTRVRDVKYTYEIMKNLFAGKDVKVDYDLHEPYKDFGSVTVIGKKIDLNSPKWFLKAAEIASNCDIYPRTDGKIQIDFGFGGLTETLE